MFGAIHQHLSQAIFDSKFFLSLSSWRNNNHDRATVHRTPFSLVQLSIIFTAWTTRLLLVIWYLLSVQQYRISRKAR